MSNHVSKNKLTFAGCGKWNTRKCPNLKSPIMQHWFLFNERTVEELNTLCDSCKEFEEKKRV